MLTFSLTGALFGCVASLTLVVSSAAFHTHLTPLGGRPEGSAGGGRIVSSCSFWRGYMSLPGRSARQEIDILFRGGPPGGYDTRGWVGKEHVASWRDGRRATAGGRTTRHRRGRAVV